MAIALVRIGQRLLKYDDFSTAYIIRQDTQNNNDWMIEIVNKKHDRSPAFFGTYLECTITLERVDIILADEYQELNKVVEE